MSPWHPLCARRPCTSRHHSTRKMHHSSPSSLASVRLAAVLRRSVGDPASAVFLGSGGSACAPSVADLVEVFAQAFAAQRGMRPSIFSLVREDVDCSVARVCRTLGFSGARTSSLHLACLGSLVLLGQNGLCSSEAAPRVRRLALRLSVSLTGPLAGFRLLLRGYIALHGCILLQLFLCLQRCIIFGFPSAYCSGSFAWPTSWVA